MACSTQKILFFSELFSPSQTSTAYYITDIACRIAENSNRQVHVFCATPSDNSQEIYSNQEKLIIHRIDKGKGNKNKFFARILKFVRISLKFCFFIITTARKNDLLFSVTNPAFIIPVCAFLKKILHYKFILLAYDLFPENLLAAGIIKKENLLYKIAKVIFDWGYREADIVISIGRDMTETLEAKKVLSERIELIQNWADTDNIQYHPKDNNAILKQYNLENKVVFLFAGNFGRVQGIPELLNVIDHVSAHNAAFLFVGDGAMREEIEKYQKNNPQKNVYCHHYLPMNEQNTFLNACDIAVVTLNDKMFGLGVPSKSYFSLASGHPVLFIGDKRSEVAQMIQEGQCGWQVSFDNITECASQIDYICSLSKRELKQLRIKASNYLQQHFSREKMLNKYSQLFERLYL